MAKPSEEIEFSVEASQVSCTGRDSDVSDPEKSEAESDISDVDSAAEDMLWQGKDPGLDRHSSEGDPEPELQPTPSKISRLESTPKKGRGRGRERARGKGKVRRRSTSRTSPLPADGRAWCDTEVPDTTPTLPPFCSARTPGSQLIGTVDYTVLELFQQFFTNTILLTLIKNTNTYGRATYKPWVDITLKDIFSFLSVVIYMGVIKVPNLTDYWRQGRLYSFPYPKSVITGKKFLSILHALHLSSPEDDAENEKAKGTATFDRLGKIKPMYTEIRNVCRNNYHPGQHISIDERMVASKARTIFKQYLKNKPVRWGFKLFVLADSASGYTWDFFVYEGKNMQPSKKGLSYDSVVNLLNTNLLGTGYKLYVDNFYTSPALFRDLREKNISACGTIRSNVQGYPRTANNALDPKSPRGSIRWLREDSLVFVQWKDTRDVSMCSTMHTAHGKETVQRNVKDNAGQWTMIDVPIPPAIKDYNRHMGGVDLSDALIGYYEVLHKTKKWYKTLFYHFLDIAIVNSYILYKEQCKVKGNKPMHQKAFRETLVLELADAGSTKAPQQEDKSDKSTHHRLVHISDSGDKSQGRLRCRKCQSKTPVKCSTCNIPLCFLPNRDCYNEWHTQNKS
uniref:PiggyBac transposable element-derived protein 4-like n=1 Tax=Stegastes partitus TaxID=144197 RepID=A0A3B5AKH3_9TELE